jgi:hypothetical protein
MLRGGKKMRTRIQVLALVSLLLTGSSAAFACEYKAGVTKFEDYANCRYGEDSIQVVQLSEKSSWESCIYFVQPFTPAKLFAVTMQQGDKEVDSLNDRGKIGNPCYLNKSQCDTALKASGL